MEKWKMSDGQDGFQLRKSIVFYCTEWDIAEE